TVGLAVGLGLINLLATLGLYRAFEIGMLSIVSPIAASFAGISVLLAHVFGGERLGAMAASGVGLVICGVVLVAVRRDGRVASSVSAAPGVAAAAAAAVGFGVVFFGLSFVTPQLGSVVPVLLFRGVAVGGALGLGLLAGWPIHLVTGTGWAAVGSVGLL